MSRAVFVLLLLLFASPAYSQVDDCRYIQRSPGTVEGTSLFIAMWQRGCTTISFFQLAPPSAIRFNRSPCEAYGVETWISPNAPAGANSTGYYQKNGNGFSIVHEITGTAGTTLYCGESNRPASFAEIAKRTAPAPQVEQPSRPAGNPNDPQVLSREERRRLMQQEDAARAAAAEKKRAEQLAARPKEPKPKPATEPVESAARQIQPSPPPPEEKPQIAAVQKETVALEPPTPRHEEPKPITQPVAVSPRSPTPQRTQTAMSLTPLGYALVIIFFSTLGYVGSRLLKKLPKQPPERTQPDEAAETSQLAGNALQIAEEEPETDNPEGVVVGIAVDGDRAGKKLALEPGLRIRHLYLIGKTRTGKTTLIKNLALQDMEQGAGVCFVDPHGDAAEDLIGSIPQHRIKDVIYFDPASDFCPAFNILNTSFAPAKLTEDIVNVLKMFFGSSWGFRMEHILRYTILTLLHDPEPRTLRDLRQMLTSEKARAEIVANVQDEDLRAFWEEEFAGYPSSAVDPIVNKLSSFLVPGSPLLQLFSQKENAIDFTRIMNEQKILIVNLSKGLLSEDPSKLLGGLIVTGIQQAALGRANMPPEQRKEFHLYLDEFQNFVVESFESILSEAAKYKLYLTLANQTLGQVPGYLKSGIFGNVATLIAFQISADDAQTMKREMHRMRYTAEPGWKESIEAERKQVAAKISEHERVLARIDQEYEEHTRTSPAQYYKNIGKPLPPGYPTYSRRQLWHYYYDDKLKRIREDKPRYERELAQYKNRLSRLNTSFSPSVVQQLFPGLELKQTSYPDTDDFINQIPRHAFCRKERAENVTLFRTLPAPDPKPELRAAIIREMQERYAHRAKQEEPKPPEPQQTPAPAPQSEISQEVDSPPLQEIDSVQAARERRAQGIPAKRSRSKTPAPQSEEDFKF